jgi:hypothetical protein
LIYVSTKHSLKKRVLLCALVAFAFIGPSAGAQSVDLSIRFFDTQVYFPDSEIRIQLTIRNDSPDPFRFRLAEDRVFNIDFDVRTLSNRRLDASSQFINARTSNQRVFYREVTLQPGAEYGFVEDLGDYVSITEPGVYVVTATFHPELVDADGTASAVNGDGVGTAGGEIGSQRLMLSIRPQPATVEEQAQASVDSRTADILRREDIAPDEVVRRTIQARQQGEWNRFFLYLNVESLLRANPARERAYLRLSEAERREELAEFREELRAQRIDEAINAIPDSFEILQTSYTPREGEVIANLRFQEEGFTAVRQYSYFLRRDDQTWEIYDYTVTNLGTAP